MPKLTVKWNIDLKNSSVSGIVGVLNKRIVDPSIPECEIGVMLEAVFDDIVYLIESKKSYVVDNDELRGDAHVDSQTIKTINEYLSQPDIEIFVESLAKKVTRKMAQSIREEIDNEIFRDLQVLAMTAGVPSAFPITKKKGKHGKRHSK
jgi:hypothetical protein